MTREQAFEIVGRMMQFVFYREGLREEPPAPLEYSLADMIEANRIVRETKDKVAERCTRSYMHCDDRLTAALYVLHHYQPDPRGDGEELVIHNGKVAVVTAAIKLNQEAAG